MDKLQEKLDRVKDEAEKFYGTIREVHCPYLGRKVNFNSKGLDHIKFKEWNKARSLSDQYLRLKFLKLTKTVIERSHTVQEFNQKNSLERQNTNSRWEKKMVIVRYYGFVAIVNEVRIKVIIKEVNNGVPYFWSVIPFWKTKNDPLLGRVKHVFYEGDLENQ
ncbi:MAG: hypothetical protein C3F02_03720 [Parcubacteria group bacterium]|nr:MAG: hypothetical protein C3F02_03720 [Parcubacteria group bacterium]